MKYPVYSTYDLDKRKRDLYILVPVTIQEFILEKKKRSEDFIYETVKRLKKQEPNIPRIEIAGKLLQEVELIETVLERLKSEPMNEKQGDESNQLCHDSRCIVFNHLTGIIVPKLFEKRSEICFTDGRSYAEFEIKSMNYKACTINDNLFGEPNCINSEEVKRLFTDVEPDVDDKDFGYTISNIIPTGMPQKAYIITGIHWQRIKLGKDEQIFRDNWQIDSLRGRGIDIGMRESIIRNNHDKPRQEAIEKLKSEINKRFERFDKKTESENAKITELNAKYSLGFPPDLRFLIEERQETLSRFSGKGSGLVAKCYGIIERELISLLNRESESQKKKIRDAVKAMLYTWKESVEKLFDESGLNYKPEYFAYFANVNGSKIHDMLFGERQAEFGAAFIALLVKFSFAKNYEPIERLSRQYPDFMVEFDNLDIKERRNKEKHEGGDFNPNGVIRLAGKLEQGLFGIDIVSALGYAASKEIKIDASEVENIANKLCLSKDSALMHSFEKLYTAYFSEDSSFYFECENMLVLLYKNTLGKYKYTTEQNKNKRNTEVADYLTAAGYTNTEIGGLRIFRSSTKGGLLAANFLDLIIASGRGDKYFLNFLSGNKNMLFQIDNLYGAVGHNGKPFEIKQCSQFFELIEMQIMELGGKNG
jgi:hypothetical protein